MKLAIMQPYFFPYLGYFQAIKSVDKYILYNNLNYIKEGWMSRNKILVKNGQPVYISVPLENSSSNNKIFEIQILDKGIWKKKILNNIFLNYKKANFFDTAFPLVEDIINYNSNLLYKLNEYCIKRVCKYLDIETEILNEDSKFEALEFKLSCSDEELKSKFYYWNLNDYNKKTIRVLEICKSMNANEFINAIGGQTLYKKNEFKNNNIDIYFIKTNPNISYKQFSESYHANLSIIDVIMHNDKQTLNRMLNDYTLL